MDGRSVELAQCVSWLRGPLPALAELEPLLEQTFRLMAPSWQIIDIARYLARESRRNPKRAVHLLDVLDESAGPTFSVGLAEQFVQQILDAAVASGDTKADNRR